MNNLDPAVNLSKMEMSLHFNLHTTNSESIPSVLHKKPKNNSGKSIYDDYIDTTRFKIFVVQSEKKQELLLCLWLFKHPCKRC